MLQESFVYGVETVKTHNDRIWKRLSLDILAKPTLYHNAIELDLLFYNKFLIFVDSTPNQSSILKCCVTLCLRLSN